MAGRVTTHPSADILKELGLGKLDETLVAGVMEHLETCLACRQLVNDTAGDEFVARLRDAVRGGAASSSVKVSSSPLPPAGNRAHAELPPELLASKQYEIIRELGRGGGGVVYLARNRLLDRQEVLKVVNRDLLERSGGKARFLREIRAAALLNHRNVVTAYSALQLGDLLVFAMEYVEGDDLARVVKAQGPLPVTNACHYARQVALGLQHAADKKMVHRDIKPHNLILAREGKRHVVKILDFGLAKIMREKKEPLALTGMGKILGTPDFMAPEQALDAAGADIRADIYSLGCTLYYLLTGAAPFKAASLLEIFQAHQLDEAIALDVVRPEVPAPLAALVRKMMAKDPAQRYQQPADVAQALAPWEKAVPPSLQATEEKQPMTPPPDHSLPDWLDDVAQSESRKPARAQPPEKEPKDVPPGQKPAPSSPPKAAALAGIPLDWLEDIRLIEESLRLPPPAAAPAAARAVPAATPVPPRPTPPLAKLAPVSAEQRGYNPETGQITDPGAYARWQKAEEKRRQDKQPPAVPVAEAFLEAQQALQHWVDADTNKALVARGDLEVIRKCPAVLDLLRRYEGYGSVMQERLWKRLVLLVDNRQKFFKAFG